MSKYHPKRLLKKLSPKAKRVTALVLCVSMVASLVTIILPLRANAATNPIGSLKNLYVREADQNTMDSYVQASLGGYIYQSHTANGVVLEDVDGASGATVRNNFGTRYAGEVWADKSVFARYQDVMAEIRPFEEGRAYGDTWYSKYIQDTTDTDGKTVTVAEIFTALGIERLTLTQTDEYGNQYRTNSLTATQAHHLNDLANGKDVILYDEDGITVAKTIKGMTLPTNYRYSGDGDFNGQTGELHLDEYTDGINTVISMDDVNQSDFLHVYSLLASTEQTIGVTPLDVVMVLDVSGSMGVFNETPTFPGNPNATNNKIYQSIMAMNSVIDQLMRLNINNRVGVVLFASRPVVLMPLAHYDYSNVTDYDGDGASDYIWVHNYYHYYTEGGTEWYYLYDISTVVSDATRQAHSDWIVTKSDTSLRNVTANTTRTTVSDIIKTPTSGNADEEKRYKSEDRMLIFTGTGTASTATNMPNYYQETPRLGQDSDGGSRYIGSNTNMDSGIYTALNMLATADNTVVTIDNKEISRIPSFIFLGDGDPQFMMEATNAAGTGGAGGDAGGNGNWWAPQDPSETFNLNTPSFNNAAVIATTVMRTELMQLAVNKHYQKWAYDTKNDGDDTEDDVAENAKNVKLGFYTIGVVMGQSNHKTGKAVAMAIMDPSNSSIGFNRENDLWYDANNNVVAEEDLTPDRDAADGYVEDKSSVGDAYGYWFDWMDGNSTITASGGSISRTFNQLGNGVSIRGSDVTITKQDILNDVTIVRNAAGAPIDYIIDYTDQYFAAGDEGGTSIGDTLNALIQRITTPTWDAVGGQNAAGVQDSVTFSDPIGDYMDVDSVTDITLFGHRYRVEPVEVDGTTDLDYDTAKDYVGISTSLGTDEKHEQTTYTVYRITAELNADGSFKSSVLDGDSAEAVASRLRYNLSYAGTDENGDYLGDQYFLDLIADGQDVSRYQFDLQNDIYIWLEDTGEWRDIDNTGFVVDNAYSVALYINVNVRAIPVQIATITLASDENSPKQSHPDDYSTNLTNTAGATPMRVFYNVSMGKDHLRYSELQYNGDKSMAVGVSLTSVSVEYLEKNTDYYSKDITADSFYDKTTASAEGAQRMVAFYSNYFTDSKYNEYPVMADNTKTSRGNTSVTFSPGTDNQFYRFQKNRVLFLIPGADENFARPAEIDLGYLEEYEFLSERLINMGALEEEDAFESWEDAEKAGYDPTTVEGLKNILNAAREDQNGYYKNYDVIPVTGNTKFTVTPARNIPGAWNNGSFTIESDIDSDNWYYIVREFYIPEYDDDGDLVEVHVDYMAIPRKGSEFGSGLATDGGSMGSMVEWYYPGDGMNEAALNAALAEYNTGGKNTWQFGDDPENSYDHPSINNVVTPNDGWYVSAKPGGLRVGGMANFAGVKGYDIREGVGEGNFTKDDNTGGVIDRSNVTSTAGTFFLPTISNASSGVTGSGVVVNAYLGNNGRILVPDDTLVVTKQVNSASGDEADLNTSEYFDFTVEIEGFYGNRGAVIITQDEFNPSLWRRRYGTIDVLTNAQRLLLGDDNNLALVDEDGKRVVRLEVVDENGQTDKVNGETQYVYYYALKDTGAGSTDGEVVKYAKANAENLKVYQVGGVNYLVKVSNRTLTYVDRGPTGSAIEQMASWTEDSINGLVVPDMTHSIEPEKVYYVYVGQNITEDYGDKTLRVFEADVTYEQNNGKNTSSVAQNDDHELIGLGDIYGNKTRRGGRTYYVEWEQYEALDENVKAKANVENYNGHSIGDVNNTQKAFVFHIIDDSDRAKDYEAGDREFWINAVYLIPIDKVDNQRTAWSSTDIGGNNDTTRRDYYPTEEEKKIDDKGYIMLPRLKVAHITSADTTGATTATELASNNGFDLASTFLTTRVTFYDPTSSVAPQTARANGHAGYGYAQIRLTDGQGLGFNNINNGSNYVMTETLTADQLGKGIYFEQLEHVQDDLLRTTYFYSEDEDTQVELVSGSERYADYGVDKTLNSWYEREPFQGELGAYVSISESHDEDPPTYYWQDGKRVSPDAIQIAADFSKGVGYDVTLNGVTQTQKDYTVVGQTSNTEQAAHFVNFMPNIEKVEFTPGAGESVFTGDLITYGILWENFAYSAQEGRATEAKVTITDVLDPGVTFVSARFNPYHSDLMDDAFNKEDFKEYYEGLLALREELEQLGASETQLTKRQKELSDLIADLEAAIEEAEKNAENTQLASQISKLYRLQSQISAKVNEITGLEATIAALNATIANLAAQLEAASGPQEGEPIAPPSSEPAGIEAPSAGIAEQIAEQYLHILELYQDGGSAQELREAVEQLEALQAEWEALQTAQDDEQTAQDAPTNDQGEGQTDGTGEGETNDQGGDGDEDIPTGVQGGDEAPQDPTAGQYEGESREDLEARLNAAIGERDDLLGQLEIAQGDLKTLLGELRTALNELDLPDTGDNDNSGDTGDDTGDSGDTGDDTGDSGDTGDDTGDTGDTGGGPDDKQESDDKQGSDEKTETDGDGTDGDNNIGTGGDDEPNPDNQTILPIEGPDLLDNVRSALDALQTGLNNPETGTSKLNALLDDLNSSLNDLLDELEDKDVRELRAQLADAQEELERVTDRLEELKGENAGSGELEELEEKLAAMESKYHDGDSEPLTITLNAKDFDTAQRDEYGNPYVFIPYDDPDVVPGLQDLEDEKMTVTITYTPYTGDVDSDSRTGGTVTWTIENAPANAFGYVELTVQVNALAMQKWTYNEDSGMYDLTGGTWEPDEDNDNRVIDGAIVEAGEVTRVTNIIVNPTGKNEKTEIDPGDGMQVMEGQEVFYEIGFANSTANTQTIRIQDRLDPGVYFNKAWVMAEAGKASDMETGFSSAAVRLGDSGEWTQSGEGSGASSQASDPGDAVAYDSYEEAMAAIAAEAAQGADAAPIPADDESGEGLSAETDEEQTAIAESEGSEESETDEAPGTDEEPSDNQDENEPPPPQAGEPKIEVGGYHYENMNGSLISTEEDQKITITTTDEDGQQKPVDVPVTITYDSKTHTITWDLVGVPAYFSGRVYFTVIVNQYADYEWEYVYDGDEWADNRDLPTGTDPGQLGELGAGDDNRIRNQARVGILNVNNEYDWDYTDIIENPTHPDKEEVDPGDGETVRIGQEITYRITWLNDAYGVPQGGGEATYLPSTVTVTDVLDPGVDFVSASFGDNSEKVELKAPDTSASGNDSGGDESEPNITISYDSDKHMVTWELKNRAARATGEVFLVVRVNENAKLEWYYDDPEGTGAKDANGHYIDPNAGGGSLQTEPTDDHNRNNPDVDHVYNMARVTVENGSDQFTRVVENPLIPGPEKREVTPGDGETVKIGDYITYKITWTNDATDKDQASPTYGQSIAAKVTITDMLDPGVDFVEAWIEGTDGSRTVLLKADGTSSDGPSQDGTDGTGTDAENKCTISRGGTNTTVITWTLPNRLAGSHGEVWLKVQVNENATKDYEYAPDGTITGGNGTDAKVDNQARVTVDNGSDQLTDIPENPVVDKVETSPGNHEGVEIDERITFEISWYNDATWKAGDNMPVGTQAGDAREATVTITDQLDPGVDFVSASFGGVTLTAASDGGSVSASGSDSYGAITVSYDKDTHTVKWVLSDRAPKASGIVTLTVKVNVDAADKWYYDDDGNMKQLTESEEFNPGMDHVFNQARVTVENGSNQLTSIPENPVRDDPETPPPGGGTPPPSDSPNPSGSPDPSESPNPSDSPNPSWSPNPSDSPNPSGSQPPDSPKTGDESHFGLWMALLGVSVIGVLGSLFFIIRSAKPSDPEDKKRK